MSGPEIPACLPDEEPLVDADVFERAGRVLVSEPERMTDRVLALPLPPSRRGLAVPATAAPTGDEPLPLPTVKVILDNIVKVGNMLGELKGDVATKDDIAAVNERLEKLEHMLKSVANVLTSIGGWIQQAPRPRRVTNPCPCQPSR